jgi:CRISPR/Cas system endoribonuclease Cas6 (RAMP superfamily)
MRFSSLLPVKEFSFYLIRRKQQHHTNKPGQELFIQSAMKNGRRRRNVSAASFASALLSVTSPKYHPQTMSLSLPPR